jgi:hypothetical protein
VVLVVMTVCATPLLSYVEADGAADAWRDAFVAAGASDAGNGAAHGAELEALASACGATFAGASTRPLALSVGAAAWSWPPGDAAPPARSTDRLVLTGARARTHCTHARAHARIPPRQNPR